MTKLIQVLTPLIHTVILIIMIYCIGSSLVKKRFGEIPIIIIVSCIILYMASEPSTFDQLGKIIVDFVKMIGVSAVETTN